MTLWKATAVLTACFLPNMGMAHNVTVGDFGGTSTNGAFVAGTWTPTADSNLDNADFQAALNTGDVTIITNGAGNIEFQNDSGPFTFPTPPRTLLLQAEGNVSVERLSTSNVTDGPLNLVINASSAVSVATTGDGVNINGGDFNSTGTDFSCNQACVDTIGGDVLLNHSGSVAIEDGGVATDGGGFTSNGTDFSCNGACIATSGGDITLNHTGSVSITDGGADTGGGKFTSSGTDFSCSSSCIAANGEDITLNHTGSVSITQGGADTGGGKFTSSGTDFSCSDVCIDTDGGNAVLNHTGNVSIKNVTTAGGEFISNGTGFSCSSGCVSTGGGDITLNHTGSVSITNGGVSTSGGEFTSHGTDFSCNGGCIYTTDSSVAADITLNHTGNVSITDGGVNTTGGRIVIKTVGDIAISGDGYGVASDGGAITLYYSANLDLATGAIISSGDPSTSGGQIILHATDSMTIEGDVTSESGSGGTVAIDEGVIVNGTTTAGAGNVRLYLRSNPSILKILGLAETVPVPALSALGVGLLAGLMLLLGCYFRRQTLA